MAPAPPPLEIHRDDGDGPTVVLLHGFPDTAATWDAIADALVADGFRVVVPHLRGYTASSIRPGRAYDAHTLATDVVDLLDHLGEDEVTLVGHDWGASMAYGAAVLDPDRITALVGVAIPHPATIRPSPTLLFGARHFLTLKMPWAALQFAWADLSGVDILYRRWAPGWEGPEREACVARIKQAMRDRRVLDATIDYYRALSPKPDRRLLGRLPQPVLVVGGDRDIVPAEAFANSAKAFTGSFESVVYPGAGHWPHREDEPRFIADLLAFLRGQQAS